VRGGFDQVWEENGAIGVHLETITALTYMPVQLAFSLNSSNMHFNMGLGLSLSLFFTFRYK